MTNQNKIYINMDEMSVLIAESIKNGCDVRLTVTGNSMYPLFRSGIDSVVLTKCSKIKKYDIPLYKRENGEYVLHRVIKIKDDEMYLLGDNQVDVEFPIYFNQVIAVVSGFYRQGKYTTVDNSWYKAYYHIWVRIIPYRKFAIRMGKSIRKALRKLRRAVYGK